MEWRDGTIVLLERADVEDFVAAGLEPGEIHITTDCNRVIPPGKTWDEACQCHEFDGGPCGQKSVEWNGEVIFDDPEFKSDFSIDGVVVTDTPDEYEIGDEILVADGCGSCLPLPAKEEYVCSHDDCIVESGVVKRIIKSVNPPAPPKSREQKIRETLDEFVQRIAEILR